MDSSVTIIPGVPTGVVLDFAGSSAPSGYLLCDGSTVSRTTYSRLFSILSTTWGAGDGSTTFNLPDLRGRVLIGSGTGSGLTARTLASNGGEESHQLTEPELATHTHIQNSHVHGVTDPGHVHSVATGSGGTYFTSGAPGPTPNPANTSTPATTGISINSAVATNQNTGGNQAHNNMQPFVVTNKIIKF